MAVQRSRRVSGELADVAAMMNPSPYCQTSESLWKFSPSARNLDCKRKITYSQFSGWGSWDEVSLCARRPLETWSHDSRQVEATALLAPIPQKSFAGREMRQLKLTALLASAEPELVRLKPNSTTMHRKVERAAASRPCRSFARRNAMLHTLNKYIAAMIQLTLLLSVALDTRIETEAAVRLGICNLFILTRLVLEEARRLIVHQCTIIPADLRSRIPLLLRLFIASWSGC